jgi:hypothetical protein
MIGINTFNTLNDNGEVAVRGTCGLFASPSNDEVRRGMVTHVLADGRLIVKTDENSDSYATISRSMFKPARDAYFSFGSYVEPEWDADSCRCVNLWATDGNPSANQAANIHTDEEVLQIHGFDRIDFAAR